MTAPLLDLLPSTAHPSAHAVMLKTVRISDVLVLCLAAGVTLVFFLCGLFLSYNPTLIITPVIFPITFTISSAYRRREDALARSHLDICLCFVCRASEGRLRNPSPFER